MTNDTATQIAFDLAITDALKAGNTTKEQLEAAMRSPLFEQTVADYKARILAEF